LRWAAWGLVGATVVFAVVLASRFGADPSLVDSPLLDKPAPGFEMQTLDGSDTVTLGGLEGEIVILNFFASWCLECRKEHDDFVATANAFAGQGVTIVQATYQEDPGDSSRYLDESGRSDSILYVHDSGSRAAISYGVFGIPETFFIDAHGTVVGKIIGESDALTLGAAIDAIRRGESPGQEVTGDTQQARD
jgi:cytochrome c biogenesis protein CcmG/thiol:disulfide interchange protein DsbE